VGFFISVQRGMGKGILALQPALLATDGTKGEDHTREELRWLWVRGVFEKKIRNRSVCGDEWNVKRAELQLYREKREGAERGRFLYKGMEEENWTSRQGRGGGTVFARCSWEVRKGTKEGQGGWSGDLTAKGP